MPGPDAPRRALGTPLEWQDAKKAANQVREWGIEVRKRRHYRTLLGFLCTDTTKQLLTIWRNARGKERDALLWGDEVWLTLGRTCDRFTELVSDRISRRRG